MKKEWKVPELKDLSVIATNQEEYVDFCTWVDSGVDEVTGVGYKKPELVWCKVHNKWHPKDHGNGNGNNGGGGTNQPIS